MLCQQLQIHDKFRFWKLSGAFFPLNISEPWLVGSEGAEPVGMESPLSFVGPGTFLEGEAGAAPRPPMLGQRAYVTGRDSRAHWLLRAARPAPRLTMVLVST